MVTFNHRRGVRMVIWANLVAALITTAAVLTAAGCGKSATSARPSGSPSATAAAMTVKAYFHKGTASDPQQVIAVLRTVPHSSAVATAAVNQLLAGPTAAERGAGYWSYFSGQTAQMLRGVSMENGVAHADFRDFSGVIPNASSSFGSAALLAELDATLKQFPTVRSTVYSFNGDVSAFYLWLQLPPPGGQPPPDTASAIAAARGYLQQVAGMQGLAAGATRLASAGVIEVDLRSDSGTGPVTTVTLQQGTSSWVPVGARTPAIRADEPMPGRAITSPVTLAGQSSTFEGQLSARVLQAGGGTVTILGHTNSIVGGSTGMAPFRGQVTFKQPSAGMGTVWVVMTYQSAKTGATAGATAMQVRFTGNAAAPRIGSVRVTSGQPVKDGWLTLPAGAGTATIAVHTTGADYVRLYLTPTGTGTAPLAKLISGGAPVNGMFTFAWHYQDKPLLDHLSVVATGGGGRVEQVPFNVTHP